MNGDDTKDIARVSDYWDEHTTDTFCGQTYWLANELVGRRYHRKAARGRPHRHWVNLCVNHFLASRCPVARMLSVGCGDGELERHLAGLKAANLIEGVDVAPRRIEIARRGAEEEGLSDVIRYTVGDVETSPFPGSAYDAIFFDASLHHIEDLEGVLSRCAAALRSDGYLFLNEYIGPKRFAFSEREREILRGVFKLIPERYRVSRMEENRGQILHVPSLPDPEEVARVDPSEAVRSDEIPAAVAADFEIEEFADLGGSLLQFLLEGIAGNFVETDADSVKVLEMIFQIEDGLVEIGEMSPHFALIVARPKARAAG